MFGQFAPPITGEAMVNEKVFEIFKNKELEVVAINSSIISEANSVGKFSFNKVKRLISVYFRFTKSIKNADVIYITPGQTLLGLLRLVPILFFCNRYKIRTVAHWHGYGLLWLIKNHPKLVRFSTKKINHNIFLTQDLKDKINAINIDFTKSSVLPNYVENIPKCQDITINKKRLEVIFLGSLMEEKGINYFIECAQRLPAINFTICGAGSQEIVNTVQSASNKFSNIKYLGTVTGNTKTQILDKSDIFVLQTHYPTEGVPLSILEAMAGKCAIVTTQHNGIPETVGDSALFVNKQSTSDLVTKLQFLDQSRGQLRDYQFESLKQVQNFDFPSFEKHILEIVEGRSEITT
jgi:glycosyltransferase involved in cell wall biosynthesis